MMSVASPDNHFEGTIEHWNMANSITIVHIVSSPNGVHNILLPRVGKYLMISDWAIVS